MFGVHCQLLAPETAEHLGQTYRPLAVEQRRAAASRDGPVAEVEHMVDLLGKLGCILMLSHKPHTALFGHTLDKK